MKCPYCHLRMRYCPHPRDWSLCKYECVAFDHYAVYYNDDAFWLQAYKPINVEIGREVENQPHTYFIILKNNTYEVLDNLPAFEFQDCYEVLKRYLKLKAFT